MVQSAESGGGRVFSVKSKLEWVLARDGKVTFQKEKFQLLLGKEFRNNCYFSYHYHCKDLA